VSLQPFKHGFDALAQLCFALDVCLDFCDERIRLELAANLLKIGLYSTLAGTIYAKACVG